MKKLFFVVLMFAVNIAVNAQNATVELKTPLMKAYFTWKMTSGKYMKDGCKYLYDNTETTKVYTSDGTLVSTFDRGINLPYTDGETKIVLPFTQTLWDDDEGFEYVIYRTDCITVKDENGETLHKIYPPTGHKFVKETDGKHSIFDIDNHTYLAVGTDYGSGVIYEIIKGTANGIAKVRQANNTSSANYGLNGIKYSEKTKGLNIVRNSDGSVKKVIEK